MRVYVSWEKTDDGVEFDEKTVYASVRAGRRQLLNWVETMLETKVDDGEVGGMVVIDPDEMTEVAL